MASVTLRGITKRFASGAPALQDLSLEVADGEFLVLLGPSGCGKTTALRCIAGLEEPTAGEIHIGTRDVTHLPPGDRDVAMVFQNYALYPHLSVRENIAFPLQMRRTVPAEVVRRVRLAADRLGLSDLLDRHPGELSGGQRQRVALGRAIVRAPQVFLFDEPLSNLDARLRVEMRAELLTLHRELGATMIFVTHDQIEAMTMGQRIAVMSQAKLQQVGAPQELYDHPLNKFVAGFIGSPSMNFLPVELTGSGENVELRSDGLTVALPPSCRAAVGATIGSRFILGIRPEHLDVVSSGGPEGTAQAKADVVEYLGNEELLHVIVAGVDIVAVVSAERNVRPGDIVTLHVPLAKIHLFDATSEASLLRSRMPIAS